MGPGSIIQLDIPDGASDFERLHIEMMNADMRTKQLMMWAERESKIRARRSERAKAARMRGYRPSHGA